MKHIKIAKLAIIMNKYQIKLNDQKYMSKPWLKYSEIYCKVHNLLLHISNFDMNKRYDIKYTSVNYVANTYGKGELKW